jgi:tetratricopeptide (TPR) repeat protein
VLLKVTEIIFLLALFLLILVVALIIFVLFAGPSLWVYACIFVLLFFLWYKPLLVLYHSFKAGHMLKQMDFEGVSAQYNKMAELKQKEGFGDYARGLAHYYRKNWIQARKSLEKALERGIKTQHKTIEPLTKIILMTTYMELGQMRLAKETMDDIDEHYLQGKKLPSKLQGVYHPLKGEWFYHNGNVDAALDCFEKGYASFPDLIGEEAYYYARLLAERQQKDEAQRILRPLTDHQRWKFFRISPEKAEALLRRIT